MNRWIDSTTVENLTMNVTDWKSLNKNNYFMKFKSLLSFCHYESPPPQFWKSNSAPCLRSSQGCCQVHEGFRGRKKLFFEIFFFFRLHILRFLLLILLLRIYYLPLKTGYRLTKRPRQRGGKFISGATKAHLPPPLTISVY